MNENVKEAFNRITEKAWHDDFFTREDVSRERAIRWSNQLKEDIKIVKSAIDKDEEKDKVLKIIARKNVCFYSIRSSKNAEEYNKIIRYTHGILEEIFDECFALTQEEFELVKKLEEIYDIN